MAIFILIYAYLLCNINSIINVDYQIISLELTMPKKKKDTPKKKEDTSSMFVRSVRLDVSERIRRYCRRERITYSKFLEKVIDLLEKPNIEPGQNAEPQQEVDEIVNPLQRVDEIAGTIKAYKNAVRLLKDLSVIADNIRLFGGWKTRVNVYLELQKVEQDLYDIIERSIPDHQIPDDAQGMEDMGLPPGLIYRDLTGEEWEATKKRNEEAAKQWKKNHRSDDFAVPEELKKRIDDLKRGSREKESEDGAHSTGDSTESLNGHEEVQPESKAASAEPSEDAKKHDAEPQARKKEI